MELRSNIIETRKLDFSFHPGLPILKDINLQVPAGSIYGFLGPNGAGKTTTLRLLLGLIKQEQSSIQIFGQDFWPNRIAVLKRIGSLIEQPSLYGHLTGRENLEVFRLSYGCDKSRISEVLAIVGLQLAAGKKAKEYSLGMKQRLAIAIALLHQPDLLILDEPTNGLDPNGIIEIRDLLRKLNQEKGITILISSHLLPEVEKIVTHLGIINQGQLIFQGTLPELQQFKTAALTLAAEVDDPLKATALVEGSFTVIPTNGQLHISIQNKEQVAEIARIWEQNQINIYQLTLLKSDLEDLFMQIINN
ncbi:ATP-binding cassette domain-containing protein [Mucilaginibacter sp. BJC16-A38]|uniref:ABC transporter ATP-binding protein n=1 Tax=Mucilaginibacter phenanthrenivorans TaxID=1234842 RepID=UPI002157BDAC|nr:ATP-binding cassette domain-containing protein [Mucilaginibacter phenanthrenivorans]MCR8561982.1 ATP-binding cassette domain-containing protein [Mucilaginibacter phenanthrenivorans]